MTKKAALVTGGSRGIGLGITEALAAAGWTVAINYRNNGDAAEDAAESARRLGGGGGDRAFIFRADISRTEEHEALLDAVIERTGRLDLLVNNAGMAPPARKDLLELTEEQYDSVLATNLRGPFFLTQRAAGSMIRLIRNGTISSPKIINITSVSADTASINRGEYCISKAGLAMMTSLYAARLAEYGIDVYEIRPGIIATDMTSGVRDKYDGLIEEGLTLNRRWGTPEDIGKAAAAIAEGAFPYSTGGVFHVDGGLHVSRL